VAGRAWQKSDFVFTSNVGTPVDTVNALRRFRRICSEAGLPTLRFNDLRHTHASLLIHEGVHPKHIAERLGHSSIKLTMDTYGHLFPGSDHESAAHMDRFFGAHPEPQPPADEPAEEKRQAKIIVMPRRKTG
jgi:integrase